MLWEYAADRFAGEKLVLDVPIEVHYGVKGVRRVKLSAKKEHQADAVAYLRHVAQPAEAHS